MACGKAWLEAARAATAGPARWPWPWPQGHAIILAPTSPASRPARRIPCALSRPGADRWH